MHFLLLLLRSRLNHNLFFQQRRTLYDAVASIKCVRDRGLDHAVERERHLKPVMNLKNLIISEPSKSLPLSVISQSEEALQIPFRSIEFIRKYPSIFQEFHPGNLNIHPHIKLTPATLALNSEEILLYQSVNYKQEIAVRLLKLLMLCRMYKLPISLLERLKWELGLPGDYEKAVIPEFPDYFRVISGNSFENGKMLELVCWSDELAVSEMEKKALKIGKNEFCLKYSNGFEMDKKYKKWVDEWQKLPYVSPYQNAMHLVAKSDEADKWAVAVLHEVLSLIVGKKAEKENLLYLGECLGLRSRFKSTLLHHPGIFYVSSKIRTHTVVLKEAYKRGMLIERHPLMQLRFRYAHLMNTMKEESKTKSDQQKIGTDLKSGEGDVEGDESGEEENAEVCDLSDDFEEEEESANKRGRSSRKAEKFGEHNAKRSVVRRLDGRNSRGSVSRSSTRFSGRTNNRDDQVSTRRSPERLDVSRNRARSKRERTTT
ncbi:protein ROOT PRIMORDIUM DEFECTIVE 1 [Olea europaea var. sylvestris]|uniref:protein ROOT PRIMORDIUM DEFECTIVE 1 n=1 Tax=Olea europaea var. sylvestris TaxID=158386 RepID=UPI000C1D36C6|nr:protein ROOT PRIMORDIUM DEFECTIVE 1 [Olea europaea var. sylvestris]